MPKSALKVVTSLTQEPPSVHSVRKDAQESASEINDDGEPPSSCPLSLVSTKNQPVNNAYQFRKRFYPLANQRDWNDWHWQLANRITDVETLAKMIHLSAAEEEALQRGGNHLPFAITPYYASLIDPNDPSDPIRLCVVPTANELYIDPSEEQDPLSEEHDEAVPGLIHRYPDRVLFLATSFCSTYCRYCTRSRMVSESCTKGTAHIQMGIEYIKAHPEIRDVLISGGDPLTMTDDALENILRQVRAIPHVEFIRIGTKVPTVLPQRITPKLTKMLRRYHPLFISIHAAHPKEFTKEAVAACARLADAGIPLGSQTVLLKGVNDNVDTMRKLMHTLLMARVRPYYLYQCDPVQGTSHFRTPVDKGVEIIAHLRGYTSGYAVPTYVIDAPGGGGK
ncbi:MAG: KamA family radical SAM protein, partial [Deferribacteraceae bacterium]|nr:KamA family radical SAM protein [Deferribacteraceae bacterium]